MIPARRVDLDTNVLVSAILFPHSTPHRAFLKAQELIVLASESTGAEFLEVLGRSRFDRYLSREFRLALAIKYLRACRMVPIPTPIRACRDPRDDKFLEVAVHGRADAILTGDADLLALHPFQGIDILTPADFLQSL